MDARFSVPNPCHRKWGELRGNGRERSCDECGTPVYAMDQYSAEEWDQVWTKSGGHLCGLFSGEFAPAQPTRRAVLAGALLTAISPLMAQNGRIRVIVTDATGSAIVGAQGLLVDAAGVPQTMVSDKSGELAFAGLAPGDWRIAIRATGFQTRKLLTNLWFSKEVRIEARLDVGTVGTFVYVGPRPQTESPGLVRIHVRNPDGEIVPGGSASVLSSAGQPIRTDQVAGSEILLRNLPLGNCRLRVSGPNLQSREFSLTLPRDEEIQIEATLPVNPAGLVVPLK